MALSIKTEEADRLARELSRLTGETMTEAVTKSLRERLERERTAKHSSKPAKKEYVTRVMARVDRIRKKYDFSKPVTKAEIDEMWGDTT